MALVRMTLLVIPPKKHEEDDSNNDSQADQHTHPFAYGIPQRLRAAQYCDIS
jgi:hypothetical protein